MTKKYYLASSEEMDKRKALAEEFYYSVLNHDEIPYVVTDDACIYDFFAGDDHELVENIKHKYGIKVKAEHFKMLFWKFLDWLEKNRVK